RSDGLATNVGCARFTLICGYRASSTVPRCMRHPAWSGRSESSSTLTVTASSYRPTPAGGSSTDSGPDASVDLANDPPDLVTMTSLRVYWSSSSGTGTSDNWFAAYDSVSAASWFCMDARVR